jgi:hypothetical protein
MSTGWKVPVAVDRNLLDARVAALTRAERELLLQVEGYAQRQAYCCVDVSTLTRDLGLVETHLCFKLRTLERKGVIVRVYRTVTAAGPILGFILRCRLDPASAIADSTDEINLARALVMASTEPFSGSDLVIERTRDLIARGELSRGSFFLVESIAQWISTHGTSRPNVTDFCRQSGYNRGSFYSQLHLLESKGLICLTRFDAKIVAWELAPQEKGGVS